MYSQLYINLSINNQVTVGLQNTRLLNDAGKSAYLTHNSIAQKQIERHFPLKNVCLKYKQIADIERKSQKKVHKSKAFLRWYFGVKISPLDITQKLQAKLESFPSNLFGLASLSLYVTILIVFGQYRKHHIKQFGNIQAQKIHECGAAMEMLSSDPRFSHVTTLTLPANNQDAFECIAAHSGAIINSLFQPLRDKYPDTNHWFFVWEYQKRGALHLHIAHYHPDESEGMLIGNILIEQWHKILCEISDTSGIWMLSGKHKGDYEMKEFYQHHTQPMRKSVAGYFAKYASKASQKEENNYIRKFSQIYPPSRFWGSSSQIKMIVSANHFHNCRDYTESKDFMYCLFVRIHKMINDCEIVLQKSYSFKKDLTSNLCVAEGFRNVYYLSPLDYQKILKAIKIDFEATI